MKVTTLGQIQKSNRFKYFSVTYKNKRENRVGCYVIYKCLQ